MFAPCRRASLVPGPLSPLSLVESFGTFRRLGLLAGKRTRAEMMVPSYRGQRTRDKGQISYSSTPRRMDAARTVVQRPRLSPIADCVISMVRTILLEMR